MHEQPDIHARLMSKYKQVPEWWYMIIFGVSSSKISDRPTDQYAVIMFVIGVISIELWHTEFPVWAFVLSLTIGDSLVSNIVRIKILMGFHSILLRHSHRDDSGHHQPASWTEVREHYQW